MSNPKTQTASTSEKISNRNSKDNTQKISVRNSSDLPNCTVDQVQGSPISDRNFATQSTSISKKKFLTEISVRNSNASRIQAKRTKKDWMRDNGFTDKPRVGHTTYFQRSTQATETTDALAMRFMQHLHGKRDLNKPTGQYVVVAHNRCEAHPELAQGNTSKYVNPHWKEVRSRESLETLVPMVSANPTMYISVNGFSRSKRRKINLESLNALFVDCDIYHAHPIHQARWQACKNNQDRLELAMHYCAQARLPNPSMVVFSGAGLYLLWAFENPIHIKRVSSADNAEMDAISLQHYRLWLQAQEALHSMLKDTMGADKQARDECRVLRIPGTYHCKREPVLADILHESQVGYEHNLIMALAVQQAALNGNAAALDFLQAQEEGRTSEISDRNLKDGIPKISDRNLSTPPTSTLKANIDEAKLLELMAYTRNHRPSKLKHGTIRSLYWQRFCDLAKLCELRGKIPKGERDVFLFWMLVCLCHAGVINQTSYERHLRLLVGVFPTSPCFQPLTDGTMQPVLTRMLRTLDKEVVYYKGASYVPLYTPSNEFLTEIFNIQPHEMLHMSTIMNREEKQRRHHLREMQTGVAQSREKKRAQKLQVIALAEKRYTVREIAAQTGIPKSTIHRWVRAWVQVQQTLSSELAQTLQERQQRKRWHRAAHASADQDDRKGQGGSTCQQHKKRLWARNPAYYSQHLPQSKVVAARPAPQQMVRPSPSMEDMLHKRRVREQAKAALMQSLQELRLQVRLSRLKEVAKRKSLAHT